MRIVKQHRRNVVLAAALGTTLAVGVVSMVVAANLTGTDTIEDRLLNASFTTLDAPVQDLDPATLCPPSTEVTCELWAKEGDIEVGGGLGTIRVWGYATSADGAPMVPGPTIVATTGDDVSIRVHNDLPAHAGIAQDVLGLSVRSMDVTSNPIAVGDVATYEFVATAAGTSVYSADAASPTGNRQIAMGLAGVLVVQPDPASCALGDPAAFLGCAYGDPQTLGNGSMAYDVGTDTFHGQALIATNEIDLALATSTDPLTFDMTRYHPTVHLINGKAYPDTQVIDAKPGDNVLVRYANLGLADHSMGLVGAHQRTIGRDGVALGSATDDVTVPLNVGQTADVMVQVPLDARAGFRYALADQALTPGANDADAAMTFLTVWGPAADPSRPTGEVTIPSSDEISGNDPLPFLYTMPGGADAVRWSVDDPGIVAFPLDGSTTDGVVGTDVLATLVNGSHILWVEWSNDGGTTWGAPSGAPFTIDRAGPVVSPVDLDPIYVNGIADTTTDVAISATGDSTLTGTGEVTGAVWRLDGCDAGAGTPMDSNGPAGVVALTAIIPDATIDGLAEGNHTIDVQAVDNRGVWSNDGAIDPLPICGSGTLVVDRGKPTVVAADVTPNDNDGTMAFATVDNYLPVVRITATISDPDIGTDPGSGVTVVEGFIEDGLQQLPITKEMFGTGFTFTAVDGEFDSPVEDVYADIPLASVATLTPGDHRIWIHGLDRAGNWGDVDTAATTLRTVNTQPEITDIVIDGTDVTVAGLAHGTGVTVAAVEYTVTGAAPVQIDIPVAEQHPYLNTTFTLAAPLGQEDNLTVRILDSVGNWSPARTARPTVVGLSVTQNRRRLSGTVVPAAGGSVDLIEWSVGPTAALPGTATSVGVTSSNFSVRRGGGFGPSGATVWVRAHDPDAGWGPVASVVIP